MSIFQITSDQPKISLEFPRFLRREASSNCTLVYDEFKGTSELPPLGNVKLDLSRQDPLEESLPEPLVIMDLPNEMLLEILIHLPVEDLVTMRGVNQIMKQLSEIHLLKHLEARMDLQKTKLDETKMETEDLDRRKRPLLNHYSSFLRVPTQELGELSWMRSCPSLDLRTVCAVVGVLSGEFDGELERLQSMDGVAYSEWISKLDWNMLRKMMTKPNFKKWCRSMPETFEKMLTEGVPKEMLLRTDVCDSFIIAQSLTYDRMRSISEAGYRLLIIAAAGLQFVHVCDELLQGSAKLEEMQAKFARLRTYVALIR